MYRSSDLHIPESESRESGVCRWCGRTGLFKQRPPACTRVVCWAQTQRKVEELRHPVEGQGGVAALPHQAELAQVIQASGQDVP